MEKSFKLETFFFLFQAGKEVLIKVILQVVPFYTMSIFKLPKALCNELEQMLGNFWWGSRDNEHKTHWMSWKRMGKAKDQGELGFRNLECFKLALLAKQLW